MQESLVIIIPSFSYKILIPITTSTLSWISETQVYTADLCKCKSFTTSMTNKTPMYWPLPTKMFFSLTTNLGKVCNDELFEWNVSDISDLFAPVSSNALQSYLTTSKYSPFRLSTFESKLMFFYVSFTIL